MPLDYPQFKQLAAEMVGFDLGGYKSHQVDRRIHSLMTSWNIADYDEFYQVLQEQPQRLQEFAKKLTINVSEFFRNPDRFDLLRDKILPELLGDGRALRVWSAGCANGAEPYSVAILLWRLAPGYRHSILATDIDRAILEKATAAEFSAGDLRNVPEDWFAEYFTAVDKGYRLKRWVGHMVEFKQQDLLNDPFDGPFDLIICRNVVIYFTDTAKDKLYKGFREALSDKGYLFVGGTEPLLNCRQLGYEAGPTGFYRKAEIAPDVFDYWRQVAAVRQKRREGPK